MQAGQRVGGSDCGVQEAITGETGIFRELKFLFSASGQWHLTSGSEFVLMMNY